MNRLQAAEQFRRAVQLFAASLEDSRALEVATLYPAYQVGRAYQAGELIAWGVNAVGDPQLYRVAQAHTAQADWPPAGTPALYTPVGLTGAGYPVWSQPSGAHDAYSAGDVVDYNGTLYKSLVDGNVWPPDGYPAGWVTVGPEAEESQTGGIPDEHNQRGTVQGGADPAQPVRPENQGELGPGV